MRISTRRACCSTTSDPPPSLDDVFLTLTGHAADGEPAENEPETLRPDHEKEFA